jgi:hypothetical protein
LKLSSNFLFSPSHEHINNHSTVFPAHHITRTEKKILLVSLIVTHETPERTKKTHITKMASTIPQNRSQSNINNILAPTPITSSSASFSHQDISRALEASASVLPKYYTYADKKPCSSASSPAAMMENVSLSGDYVDHHYFRQPPPPPPSPVGFPFSSSMHDWSAVERKRG